MNVLQQGGIDGEDICDGDYCGEEFERWGGV